MPCAEKKIGITSQIRTIAPANNTTCPKTGLMAVRTDNTSSAGSPNKNNSPIQMSESNTACLRDFQSERTSDLSATLETQ